jgi:hypothetical protein
LRDTFRNIQEQARQTRGKRVIKPEMHRRLHVHNRMEGSEGLVRPKAGFGVVFEYKIIFRKAVIQQFWIGQERIAELQAGDDGGLQAG